MADEIKAVASEIADAVLGGDFESINIDDGDEKDEKPEENGTATVDKPADSVAADKEKENNADIKKDTEKEKEKNGKEKDGGRAREDRDKENGETKGRGDKPNRNGGAKGGGERSNARDGGGGGRGGGGGGERSRGGQERRPGGGGDGGRKERGKRDAEKGQGASNADAAAPGPLERAKVALKDRKCLTKLIVGIAVALLLLIVIIVVAVVVPRSSGGGSTQPPPSVTEAAAGGRTETTTPLTTTTRDPGPPPLELTPRFQVRLGEGQGFQQILAAHGPSRQYVLVLADASKTIYVIVDFLARMRTVLGVVKSGGTEVTSRIVDGSVLFCLETRFSVDFTGDFLDATALERSNDQQYISMSGRNTTILLTKETSALILPSVVAAVFAHDCARLPSEAFVQWDEQNSCSGVTVPAPQIPNSCPETCPRFNEAVTTLEDSCSKFQKCNTLVGRCDPFFTEQRYTGRPYCSCRSTLTSDVSGLRCAPGNAQCQDRQAAVERTEGQSPCYCKYRISHVNPYVPGGAREASTIAWLFDSYRITAVATSFQQCDC